MSSDPNEFLSDTPQWRLRNHLLLEAKKRYDERRRNPDPDREFLLRERPKKPFEKEGWDIEPNKITLAMAADRYLEKVIRPTRTEKNYRAQKNQVLFIIDQWGEDARIVDIGASHLTAFRDSLVSSALTNSTCNSYIDIIQKILRACVELWGVLDSSPRIKRFQINRKKQRILTYEEEVRLLKVCPIHLRRLLIFLLGTGVRKSDAVNLKWDQVFFKKPDETRGRVKIWASKTLREYSVPLATHVENMLRDMKAELPEEMPYVFTFIPKKNFRGTDGRLSKRRGIAAHYKSEYNEFPVAKAKAELNDVTIHCFRHTFATRLIEKNVPVYDVAKLLGHQGLRSVMNYAHANPAHFDPVIGLLDRPLVPGVYSGDAQPRYEGML